MEKFGTDPLSLAIRRRLPPELCALLDEIPRVTWPDHPEFGGLAAFWLDRHMGFRHMLARMREVSQALDGGRIDPDLALPRIGGLGQRMVGDLEGHHHIEDEAYFPELARLEPRLARGFDLLDHDHRDLHDHLQGFVTEANRLLSAKTPRALAGAFDSTLERFETFLDRHLTDEEDLILPVILKHRFG